MTTRSKDDGYTNPQDGHTMDSWWPHGGLEGHTTSTRRCIFGKTFGNFSTCQRFYEHSRSCSRTLKTQPVVTRWLRMQSRMTRCLHDHSRCCKFPSSCVHPELKSGQCEASIRKGSYKAVEGPGTRPIVLSMITGSYCRRRRRLTIFEPDEKKFGVSLTLLSL